MNQFGDIRDHEDIHRPGDHLIKAMAMDGEVRISAVDVTDTVRRAQTMHDMGPTAGVAVGRAISAAALLAQDMKGDEENLTLSVRGDGPLGGFTIVVESGLKLRASVVNPHCETLSKPGPEGAVLDIGAALGAGRLSVIRDFGQAEPYIGQIPLQSGEIAEDITAYLVYSEQRPAAVGLAANISTSGMGRAGGFLLEPMPGASQRTLDYIEARVAGFPGLDFFLEEGFTAAQVIDLIMGNVSLRYLERTDLEYQCNCSRDRMERNLLALGHKELKNLSEDPKGIQLECHFCDSTYTFTQEEVKALYEQSQPDIRFHDNM